jgi:hypothetical protein
VQQLSTETTHTASQLAHITLRKVCPASRSSSAEAALPANLHAYMYPQIITGGKLCS